MKHSNSESVCPVIDVKHGLYNTGSCLSESRCQVGKTLEYTCESGFTVSSPTTTCLEDHTWSASPMCTKGKCEHFL